jgi:sulfate transport system ATP-binding protein
VSIELKNVSKSFGQVAALRDVSFAVNEGELAALLGPSGSGKTTVLRLIAGLETPDNGRLFVRGAEVSAVPVQRRNIGFVFQNYALFRNMSVWGNIAFGLSIKKWRRPQIAARVAELADFLDLHDQVRRYPHQLSGGQRQRVAIARALAPGPDVLLLDEPFAAVDAQIRQELRQWLIRLHHEIKLTTIFVTHDQEEAMEVADRIVVFSQGRLEQIGTPQEVYEKPHNEFVARFVGVLNVLELEVRDGLARCNELEFPAHGLADGQKMRIGFRPYNVQVSPHPAVYPFRALLRRTYFLGVMLRLEMELPSGLVIRSRLSKEEYARLGLADGREVSFQIRTYRILSKEGGPLGDEVATSYETRPLLGEGI